MTRSVGEEHLIYPLHALSHVQKTLHFQQSHKPPLVQASFLALLRLKNGKNRKERIPNKSLKSTKAPARAQSYSSQNPREVTDHTDLNAIKDRLLGAL